LALGTKTPRKNLTKSKTLRAVGKEYGYSGYLTGYVDTERLAGIFTGNTRDQDKDAESLVMVAAMMDPQIAALNLLPDGKSVKLELAQLAEFAGDAFAALSTDTLSISLGESAEAKSANMLVADSAEPASDAEDAMPKAIRDAMRDVMILSGSMYERMSVEVRFANRGVEINSAMKLSD
jgi:hypothetical protein